MPIIYEALSRNIKSARKTAGYTQEHAAESLGMSTINYGRLERGQRKVSLEQLSDMAILFGCSVFSLMRGCFPIDVCTVFEESDPSDFSGKVVTIMAGCSEEEQELIYELCRFLVYRKAISKSAAANLD